MPATAITTSASRIRVMRSSRRCRPATPASYILSTVPPRKARVTAASSATARSDVPAHTTAARPGSGVVGPTATTMQRAASS